MVFTAEHIPVTVHQIRIGTEIKEFLSVWFIKHHQYYYCIINILTGEMDELPHWANHIRLSKLNDNSATAKLMTRVSRVPVIVFCIAVYQCITTSTNSLKNESATRHCCNVLCGNWKKTSVKLQRWVIATNGTSIFLKVFVIPRFSERIVQQHNPKTSK